jgi:hypothetical protein
LNPTEPKPNQTTTIPDRRPAARVRRDGWMDGLIERQNVLALCPEKQRGMTGEEGVGGLENRRTCGIDPGIARDFGENGSSEVAHYAWDSQRSCTNIAC